VPSLFAALRGHALGGTLGRMFYAYLVAGLVLFGVVFVLVPGWWKLLWVVGALVFAAFIPLILEKILDPVNAGRIRDYCAKIGVTNVEVRAFPNHYGVHFEKNDKRHYAKCVVTRGQISWKGLAPEDVQ
jgi:hypothetical protein